MLEIVFIFFNWMVENVEVLGGFEMVMLIDGILFDERMVFFIFFVFLILFFELRKIFICDLIVVVFLLYVFLFVCEL